MDKQKICSISPREFEMYCKDILVGYAEMHNLNEFKIDHNVKLKCHNGKYQIDIYATFKALNVDFKIICECKQYSSPVKREPVVTLADKVKSLGAHKGILMSTCKFQSGAVQYAKEVGIALIEVFDNDLKYYSFSNGQELSKDDPFYYAATKYPYKAIECTADFELQKNIYPTRPMILETLEEMNKMLAEYRL